MLAMSHAAIGSDNPGHAGVRNTPDRECEGGSILLNTPSSGVLRAPAWPGLPIPNDFAI